MASSSVERSASIEDCGDKVSSERVRMVSPGVDLDYNDSTVHLVLTEEGEEGLMELDSAFHDGGLIPSREERRAVMKRERERMKSMCFTFRADPFSHRHTNSKENQAEYSWYTAQAHDVQPLLYNFEVEAPSTEESAFPDAEGSPPNVNASLAGSSGAPPFALPNYPPTHGTEEPNGFTFESTAQFSAFLASPSPPSTPSPSSPVDALSSFASSSSSTSSSSLHSLGDFYAERVKQEIREYSPAFGAWGTTISAPSLVQYPRAIPPLTRPHFPGEYHYDMVSLTF